MEQYLRLLKEIKEKGVHKDAARANMPGTTSLFGYQFRHNLATGFPLLTTKKMFWKGIVVELLWFLKGDTNIKYLIDNGVNIWNQDAYNYYCKIYDKLNPKFQEKLLFNEFINFIENPGVHNWLETDFFEDNNYHLGDCGYQYGKVWRDWEFFDIEEKNKFTAYNHSHIDQVSNLISGLKNNPEGRRHILTSIDPAHQDDLALYWCHALSQFNCRPLTIQERIKLLPEFDGRSTESLLKSNEYPKYYLDCQMYQRSGDVVLGVPFNIASYALLTHILCKICNMVPGEMIYTYGDVHIYEDHMKTVEEQLLREPKELPFINIDNSHLDMDLGDIEEWDYKNFILIDYEPHPKLENEAKLNTGLHK